MNEPQVTEDQDVEYFQKLLLERLASLQRSQGTEAERQRINMALERLRTGDYWYCVKCGEDITEERLQVHPTTLTCVECAPGPKKK